MAPRFKHSFKSLCDVIVNQPKGVPYTEVLGSHSEGLLTYDGTVWTLRPRLVDEERCNAAYREAMDQKKGWFPESVESFRTIIGPPICSHHSPNEFIALLAQLEHSSIYWHSTSI